LTVTCQALEKEIAAEHKEAAKKAQLEVEREKEERAAEEKALHPTPMQAQVHARCSLAHTHTLARSRFSH